MSEWQPCVEPSYTRLAIDSPMSVTRLAPPVRPISPGHFNPSSKAKVVTSVSQTDRSSEWDTGDMLDIPADLDSRPSQYRSERAGARSAPSRLGRAKLPGKALLTSARDLQDYTTFHSYRVRERPFGEWKPMLVGGRQLGQGHKSIGELCVSLAFSSSRVED